MQTLITDHSYSIQGSAIKCSAVVKIHDDKGIEIAQTAVSTTAALNDPTWPTLVVKHLRDQGISFAADVGARFAATAIRNAYLSPDASVTMDGAIETLMTQVGRQMQQVLTGMPVDSIDSSNYPYGDDLEHIKRLKELEIRTEGARRLEELALPYLPQERNTWPSQLAEAEAWLADPDTFTPILTNIAAGRGITVADLVPLVMGNADLFRQNAGEILGVQQRLINAVWSAVTPEQVVAISW